MKVKLIKHDITINVIKFDEKTKMITVKFFGKLCSFRVDEYEVVSDE